MERVERCQTQIWEVSEQILKNKGNVILDLGFTTKSQRNKFVEKSNMIGASPEVHYLEVSTDIRKQRVKKRNSEKDPNVYAFEVTDQMFEFMEPRFEIPDNIELKDGKIIQNI
jgi:predicted kinase